MKKLTGDLIPNYLKDIPILIGNLLIYPEQIRAAKNVIEMFLTFAGPPLLVAKPQQGKTGVAILVIHLFLEKMKAAGYTCEVIFLTNLADNSLRDQTKKRIRKAGLKKDVKVIHHSNLKNLDLPEVDFRLVIVDECHVALDASTSEGAKPFHEFTKRLGIRYGESIDTWGESKYNTFVLSMSATPYAHILAMKSKIKQNAFQVVRLEQHEKYCSLEHMHNMGRIRKSKPVVIGDAVTPFFEEVLEEALKRGPGYLVVRATGKRATVLHEYLCEKDIQVQVFESKVQIEDSERVSEIDAYLSEEPFGLEVVIIRGGMRAGKTLTTTEYMSAHIESSNSNGDSTIQAIRYTGTEEGHDRRLDDFPIYCNTKEIDAIIDFYTFLETVPSGVQNKPNQSKERVVYEPILFDHLPSDEEIAELWLKHSGSPLPEKLYRNTHNVEIQSDDTVVLWQVMHGTYRHTDSDKRATLYHLGTIEEARSKKKSDEWLQKQEIAFGLKGKNPEWRNATHLLVIPRIESVGKSPEDALLDKTMLKKK